MCDEILVICLCGSSQSISISHTEDNARNQEPCAEGAMLIAVIIRSLASSALRRVVG